MLIDSDQDQPELTTHNFRIAHYKYDQRNATTKLQPWWKKWNRLGGSTAPEEPLNERNVVDDAPGPSKSLLKRKRHPSTTAILKTRLDAVNRDVLARPEATETSIPLSRVDRLDELEIVPVTNLRPVSPTT